MAIVGDQELGRGKVREAPRPGTVFLCPLCVLPSNIATAVIGIKEAAVFFCSSWPRCLALRGMWLAVLVRSGENLRLGSGNEAIASLARPWLSASLLQQLAVLLLEQWALWVVEW